MQGVVAPNLVCSGLYQTLVEGILLLLETDPATYPQTLEEQELLWDSQERAMATAVLLAAGVVGAR
jgi:hypothetical protein